MKLAQVTIAIAALVGYAFAKSYGASGGGGGGSFSGLERILPTGESSERIRVSSSEGRSGGGYISKIDAVYQESEQKRGAGGFGAGGAGGRAAGGSNGRILVIFSGGRSGGGGGDEISPFISGIDDVYQESERGALGFGSGGMGGKAAGGSTGGVLVIPSGRRTGGGDEISPFISGIDAVYQESEQQRGARGPGDGGFGAGGTGGRAAGFAGGRFFRADKSILLT